MFSVVKAVVLFAGAALVAAESHTVTFHNKYVCISRVEDDTGPNIALAAAVLVPPSSSRTSRRCTPVTAPTRTTARSPRPSRECTFLNPFPAPAHNVPPATSRPVAAAAARTAARSSSSPSRTRLLRVLARASTSRSSRPTPTPSRPASRTRTAATARARLVRSLSPATLSVQWLTNIFRRLRRLPRGLPRHRRLRCPGPVRG